jgi:hypothetical protein
VAFAALDTVESVKCFWTSVVCAIGREVQQITNTASAFEVHLAINLLCGIVGRVPLSNLNVPMHVSSLRNDLPAFSSV